MKYKVFSAYTADELEGKVTAFLDSINQSKQLYHIVNYSMTATDGMLVATFLYMKVDKKEKRITHEG
jgi:hypothetical protein